jgi:hypothetical protein
MGHPPGKLIGQTKVVSLPTRRHGKRAYERHRIFEVHIETKLGLTSARLVASWLPSLKLPKR